MARGVKAKRHKTRSVLTEKEQEVIRDLCSLKHLCG